MPLLAHTKDYLCICVCLLCTVVCMHNFHSAHIFIVYNSVQYVRYLQALVLNTHTTFKHYTIISLQLYFVRKSKSE